MKRIYSFIAILLTFFNICTYYFIPASVMAASEYRRVIDQKTPFFQSIHDSLPIFYLPYTYYVRIIGSQGELTHVQLHGDNGIAGIDGYVPTDLLFYDGLEVANPFLNLDITTAGTTVLYQDQYLSIPSQYIFAERKLKYYGHVNNSTENIYYVSYNNKLGYVRESEILPFVIPNHPNELTFIVEPTPPPVQEDPITTQPQTQSDAFGLKAIIIICLLFAGIIALFISLGKKNDTVKTNYYEENDYE